MINYERLTPEQFLEKIKTSDDHSIVMDRSAYIQLTVWNNGVEENYDGPDPIETGYVKYMHFLGLVEKASDVKDLFRHYLQDRLRS